MDYDPDETIEPAERVHFRCTCCRHRFDAAPEQVVEDDRAPEHPWRYLATCPQCGGEARQAGWERAAWIARFHSTGPRTDSGKRRTRFNAMKHGLTARVAPYFPAKPGRYPDCEACPFFDADHPVQSDCMEPPRACLRRIDPFLRTQAAFETGEIAPIRQLVSDAQASLQILLSMAISAIMQDGGPRLKDPVWYNDQQGNQHFVWIEDESGQRVRLTEIKAHPLIKHVIDLAKANGMTLVDAELTPRTQSEERQIEGYLSSQAEDRESILAYQQRQTEQVEALRGYIERSENRREREQLAPSPEDPGEGGREPDPQGGG